MHKLLFTATGLFLANTLGAETTFDPYINAPGMQRYPSGQYLDHSADNVTAPVNEEPRQGINSTVENNHDSYRTEADRLLIQKIRSALARQARNLDPKDIQLSLSESLLTVTGRVHSKAEGKEIVDIIKSVPGVHHIEANFSIPAKWLQHNGWTDQGKDQNDDQSDEEDHHANRTADRDLLNRIIDTIKTSNISPYYKDIHINISRGIVTLSGVVEYDEDRKNLINKVRSVSGVRDVRDMLEVKPGLSKKHEEEEDEDHRDESSAMDSMYYYYLAQVDSLGGAQNAYSPSTDEDHLVLRNVNQAIRNISPDVTKYANVNVQVWNGYVILNGSVKSYDDKYTLERQVSVIPGVKAVNNQVTISPLS
jgi:osmotically-inducible protein OsmY